MSARPRPVETRVVTANIPVRKMTRDQAGLALGLVLDASPHYAALQEWRPGSDGQLGKIAQRRGYDHARAHSRHGSGPLVLWHTARAAALHVRPLLLSRAERVGHLPGRKDRLEASVATEVVVEDDVLGEGVVISAHLTAEVQVDGAYRADLAHRLRVWRHKRECRRLRRRERHHLARGRWVRVGLDGNYAALQLPPLRSCWDGRKGGTLEGPAGRLSDRAVDIVFADQPAVDVETIPIPGGDHRAVVAHYIN